MITHIAQYITHKGRLGIKQGLLLSGEIWRDREMREREGDTEERYKHLVPFWWDSNFGVNNWNELQ